MAHKKISRNDPCPCGSGKKFKFCCIGKNIDWGTRPSGGTKRPSPSPVPKARITRSPGLSFLRPFHVVDARLKEVARVAPGAADWKAAVEGLSDTTPDGERIAFYKAIRDAGVLPADAALFLFGHAVQWMTSEEDDLDPHRRRPPRTSCRLATRWRWSNSRHASARHSSRRRSLSTAS